MIPEVRRVPLLAAAACALATAAMSLAAFHADAARSDARDSEARAQAAGALEVLTAGLQSRVVDVRSLFVSSQSVSEREFRVFTQPMVGRGHANGLNWLQKVTPGERAALEREIGAPISTLSPDGRRLIRDTTPGTVFPIRYAAVGVNARSVVGFNAYPRTDRREAIERAIASGRPASTPLLHLASSNQPGFVLYAPVYKPGGRHLVEDVLGVVAGSFSVGDAQAAVQRAVAPGTAVRVRLEGSDMLRAGSVDRDAPATSFRFAGRVWSVQSAAAPGGGLRLGPVTLAGGVLVTVLLLLVGWGRSSRRALTTGRRDRDLAERRFLDTFASAPIGMALVAPVGEVIRVNRAFCELLGRSEDQLRGRPAPDVILAEDRLHAAELFVEAGRRPGDAVDGEIRLLTAAGVRWTESHVTYLAGEDLLLIQAIDITDRREFEDQLVHQAEHDSLTELLNRRGFRRIVGGHLAAQADAARGAIMLLDLDHFKAVNDLHGHRAGDRVLEAAARVLRDCVRDGDPVARLGGDEFAVLLPNADADQARAAATRLLEALADPDCFPGVHSISASIGVAMLATSMQGPDDALVAADLAMYDAKDAGRNRYAFFDERTPSASATRDRLEWVEKIRSALAEDRLVLAAQPIRCVRSGAVVHHELLLRMREPDGREIPPGAFLGVAEEFGLIGEIDLWVARSAIAILDRHRDQDLVFHVNLSGRSLGDEALLASIRAELERTGVDPTALVFEITETAAVTNLEAARAFAEQLTAMGCRLALDDFGAGFSSFVYLKQLPFDILKIDGEFVRQCTTTPADRVILESLVHTASGLNKQTVAEFVEDQETEDLLRELGVDLVQGYHVGRPIGVEAAIAALPRVPA
jgi:diguanylate cyclase (GGDEF)-like protein/PAS domain S-box-containing protein